MTTLSGPFMASGDGSGMPPRWLNGVLGAELAEGEVAQLRGREYVVLRGIPRALGIVSEEQGQTREAFDFKWSKRETFESEKSLQRVRGWLIERYGDVGNAPWWDEYGPSPLLLDAGCGAGMSVIELFGGALKRVRYLGVDISGSVEVAAARFKERRLEGAFMQASIQDLPLEEQSVDVIFSEGVLHHTDSTERAIKALARHLKPGGRFLFYVYRKKGPIREFTDDYIRSRIQGLDPEQAWNALMPLTCLGIALGELNVEVDVPEPIPLLGIPAGRIPIQRFFYWNICKAFYHPDLDVDETNHINFDWFMPANAHRQTPEEVQAWCRQAALTIEREVVEDAGITIVARKE